MPNEPMRLVDRKDPFLAMLEAERLAVDTTGTWVFIGGVYFGLAGLSSTALYYLVRAIVAGQVF